MGEADRRAASLLEEQLAWSEQRAASDAARQALAAYWELWYAQQAAGVQTQSREVVARQLADLEVQIEAGQLAPFAALSLSTALAAADETLASAELGIERARTALAQAIGETPERAASWAADADERPHTGPVPEPSEVGAVAAEAALELREWTAQIDQAEVAVQTALDAAQIRLDARAWVSTAGLGDASLGDAYAMMGRFEAVSGYAGLEVALPFDRTSLTEAVVQAQLNVAQLQAQRRQAALRIQGEAVDAVQAWQAASIAAQSAERTAAIAAESVKGHQARLESGAGTALELVVAEQDRVAAELRRIRAHVDAEVARLRTQHLTHQLLSELPAAAAR